MKTLIKRSIKISLFFLIIVLFIKCGNPALIDKSMDVNESSWEVQKKLIVEVNIDDSLSTYNFFVNLRNTTDYKYSNFFLFVKTIFPNKQTAVDTLECLLADNQGKWFGKGNDKIKDNKILFKKDAIFPMKGKYVFEIEHAMRETSISGIKSVGICIEKNKTR